MNVRVLILLQACVVLAAVSAQNATAANRSITGAGNNLLPGRANQGAAGTDVIRIGYPADYPDGYGDHIYGASSTPVWPNARTISNTLSAQAAPVSNNRNLSDWVVQWGQFLTHDLDLTGTSAANNNLFAGGTGTYSIPVTDPLDPLGPNPIAFNRSNYNPTTGTTARLPAPGPIGSRPNWREQVNSVTSYIDASNVYGSDTTRAAALRTFSDGKLVTSAGGLLPGLNTVGLANDDPFGLGTVQFLAGDVRANEQVGLTATHALFTREHNRLAGLLKAGNPSLSDEVLYQSARKIVGAEMQIVTYKEFLPALLGSQAPNPVAFAYNSQVDASITNSFSTAFFRFGHSMQSSEIQLVDNTGRSAGSLPLQNAFFNPSILQNSPTTVDLALKGLASQVAQENDVLIVDDLRNFLFGPPGAGGLDLAALDIQRGRDHGLLDYNELRPAYGLQRLNSIAQLTSDVDLRAKLTAIYGNIDSIDAFVGGLAENHLSGASVGSMVMASLVDQFTRLRDGDRFFYTGDSDLQTSLVTSVIDLNSITLGQIMRFNTSVTNLQDNVFFAVPIVDYFAGDANGDRVVDFVDLGILLNNYNQAGVFATGDFDDSGTVDFVDLGILLNNYNQHAPISTIAAPVPEPSTLLLGLMSIVGLVAFARRRGRNG